VIKVFLSKVGAAWNSAFNAEREAKRAEFQRRADASSVAKHRYWHERANALSRKRSS
jgi:hypothetical protein